MIQDSEIWYRQGTLEKTWMTAPNHFQYAAISHELTLEHCYPYTKHSMCCSLLCY
ncbi:hypothetical protein WG66_003417 [Moniliophthora roreri]|nr:hypothetical protein WG66_003417 [Moniliophthora roreri]